MRPSFSQVARYVGAILVIGFALAYMVWRPVHASGPALGDFAAYYAAGRVWHDGRDPYGNAVWGVERELPHSDPAGVPLVPYVGPPLGLPLWAAFAALPYPLAAVIWGCVCAACIAVIFVCAAQLAGTRIRKRDAVALVLLAAASGPLVDAMSLGQASLPASAAVAAAIAAMVRRRWVLLGFFAFLAALFKPNLALGLVAALRSFPALASLGLAACASALGNVATVGGTLNAALAYLHIDSQMIVAERFYSYQFTPTAIAYDFGMTTRHAMLFGQIVAMIVIVVTAVAIYRSQSTLAEGAAIGCTALPFVVPYVHEADFAIAFLPGLAVIYRARGRPWLLAASGLALLAVAPYALTQGGAGIAFALVAAAVAAVEIAALARGIPLAQRLVPLGVVAIVVIAGAAAPRHRLPLSPAPLAKSGTSLHAAPSDVWHRELQRGALLHGPPYVALLRTLSLCACLMIAAAMTEDAWRWAIVRRSVPEEAGEPMQQ